MPIITIYQGASGSGEELAQTVANALNYRCVGREVLVETSRTFGIPEAKLNDIIEKGSPWWERLLQNLRPYRIALQAAFCEIAQGEKIVYHGHIGHELLPGIRHVLRVLLTAPVEMRIEQVRARHKLNEGAAHRYVEEVDRARTRRLMAMFGTDWRDPSRYDLVVNLGRMSLEGAALLIVRAAHLLEYQPTADSEQAFQDLALSAKVHATLLMSQTMQGATLDVKAKRGEVSVSGTLPHWVSEDEVIEKVKRIPGVHRIVADLVSAPPEIA